MLLPLDLVPYQLVEDRVVPTWLTEQDEPFVGTVLERMSELAGLSTAEADIVARSNLSSLARAAKLPRRVAESVWLVERRRWETAVDAPVSPESLRDVLFELSARLPPDEAIAEAARRLCLPGAPPSGLPDAILKRIVLGTLFADRASRRILQAPALPASPADVVARYNLSLLQTLVARAMEIEATVSGDPSAVVVAAKRAGLLGSFEHVDGARTAIRLAGPLAIFHDTTKYGRSLARFVPSLLSANAWSLDARLDLGQRSARLVLEVPVGLEVNALSAPFSGLPRPAFPALLPSPADGRLARRLARVLRGAGVRVDRDPPLLRAGAEIVVADFCLEWSGGKVFVDVVPFATRDYLEAKRAIAERLEERLLVCVDARFAASFAGDFLMTYRQDLDPWALFAAARRLAGDVSSTVSA